MKVSTPNTFGTSEWSEIDLADPKFYTSGDPHAVWRYLRKNEPVHKHRSKNGDEFWVVTKYDDVSFVLKDHKKFTSEQGSMLCIINQPDIASGQMMVVTDPPHHGRFRYPLTKLFTREAVEPLKASLQRYYASLLDTALAKDEWDFAEGIKLLPMNLMGIMMGLPEEDWSKLSDYTMMSVAYDDPAYAKASMHETLKQSHYGLLEYFLNELARRRKKGNKRGDMIDLLMTMDTEQGRLTDTEIIYNCYSMILGAAVTTPYTATSTVKVMADDHKLYDSWVQNPHLISSAVEEGLRWSSPATHLMRYALSDVEIRGTKIRKGDAVTAWIGSANHDEDVFDNPFKFDLARSPNHHITFGIGVHYCIGAPLARLSLETLFEEILNKVQRFELADTPVSLISNFTAGFKHLPVRMFPK